MTTPTPDLRDRIIEVARHYAESRGWPWRLPVDATLSRSNPADRQWTVRTNAFAIGMNARIVVRESDLSVIDAGYLKR